MKRNKHHGLNVEFDGLCMDFGHVSLNKKKEFLCGDCYKIEENDEDHVLVLSDGLGSGGSSDVWHSGRSFCKKSNRRWSC